MDVRTTLVTILAEIGKPFDGMRGDESALDLESLDVLLVHDRIEQDLGVRLAANEVRPETFGTLASLVALVSSKLNREAPVASEAVR